MASLWAKAGALVTVVDLNPMAIVQNRGRRVVNGLMGAIEQADGRRLPFDSGEFDYVYSWCMLHHSPRLDVSIADLLRCLKPGGEHGVMLNHGQSFLHWYWMRYLEGFLHAEQTHLDDLGLTGRYSDGFDKEANPHT